MKRLAFILVASLGCTHAASRDAALRPSHTSDPSEAPRTGLHGCALEHGSTGPFTLRFDLLGYLPDGARSAMLLGDGHAPPRYRVCDLASGTYQSGFVSVAPATLDVRSLAGSRLVGYPIDLSSASRVGRYAVVLEGGGVLGPFSIDPEAYANVPAALLAFMRTQRCGATTVAISGHGPCHRFASIGDGDPATHSGDGIAVADGYLGHVDVSTGPAVNVEGGWHDAGDYVKFLGTTAFVVALDLITLRDHSSGFATRDIDALIDEVSWGADWIERMVSPAMPMHQVSGEMDHDVAPRRPEADTTTPIRNDDDVVWEHRPAYRIDVAHHRGGNVLGRSVAALALWSRVVPARHPGDASLRATADRRLALARRIYDLAITLPRPQESDPPEFYPEASVHDDLAFAASVLATVTHEPRYRDEARAHLERWMSPDNSLAPEAAVYWGDVTALALAETARLYAAPSPERQQLHDAMAGLVAPVAATREHPTGPASAFHYALPILGNGSVALVTGAAVACLVAESIGAASGCRDVAETQVHWVFGQNPFGVTFVPGVGPRSPRHVHHDLARVTGESPLGAVVGGPSSLAERERSGLAPPGRSGPAAEFAAFSTREMFYQDSPDDYVVNESAIDFTPALLYLVAALGDRSTAR